MISAPSLPGRRWPCVRSYEPWQLFLELCRTENMSHIQVHAGQRRQLRELVYYARNYVPYYQRVFEEHEISETFVLEQLPILTRRDLIRHQGELTPRRLPAGLRLAGSIRTSGSTGEPVTVHYTQARHAWYAAHMMRYLDWIGVDQSLRFAAIRYTGDEAEEIQGELANGVECSSWDAALTGLVETGPAHVMSIDQDPRVQYQWLKRIEPSYLLSHPSNLRQLARLVADFGAIGSIEKVLSFGEAVSETDRDEIEEAFGAQLFDAYSSREVGFIATECRCGFYHVHSENVLVEILDDEGMPSKPGETGRVVLTALTSFAMPLIRYDLGDRARLPVRGEDTCSRVQGLQSLVSIEGRQLPSLLMPDGSRKDPLGLVSRMNGVAQSAGLLQYTITQSEPDEVVITAVPDEPTSADVSTVIDHAVAEFFGTLDMRVKVSLVPRIALTPAGKAPPIVRCLV